MSESDLLLEFGSNLQSILYDIRMTQGQLARAIGTNRSTVSRYIKGEQMPSLKTIVNIIGVTGCRFNDLVCDIDYVE